MVDIVNSMNPTLKRENQMYLVFFCYYSICTTVLIICATDFLHKGVNLFLSSRVEFFLIPCFRFQWTFLNSTFSGFINSVMKLNFHVSEFHKTRHGQSRDFPPNFCKSGRFINKVREIPHGLK